MKDDYKTKDILTQLSHDIVELEKAILCNNDIIYIYEKEMEDIKFKYKSEIDLDKQFSNELKRKIELEQRLSKDNNYLYKLDKSKKLSQDIKLAEIQYKHLKRIINIEIAFKDE